MFILLGVIAVWAASAVASIVCWSLYMLVWTGRHRHTYPTIAACAAAFDRTRLNRVFVWWISFEVLPVLWLFAQWHRYQALLAHQHTLAQLRRIGWQVESQEHADGSLEVICTVREPVSLEMVEHSQAIVEEGLHRL